MPAAHETISSDALERHVAEQLQELLAGYELLISGTSARSDLAQLEQTLAAAQEELVEFAADTTLRKALGERFSAVRDARVAAVDEARAAYEAATRDAVKRPIDPAELDGDLGGLARALLERIEVSPPVTPTQRARRDIGHPALGSSRSDTSMTVPGNRRSR